MNQSKGSKTSKREAGSASFFVRMFSFLSSSGDPEREKKNLLKEISKQLKKQRFKFYRPKTKEVLPALARFFYDIYKTVAAAHMMVEHAEASNVLKAIVIENFLSEAQQKIAEKFDEEVVRKRAEEIPQKDLAAEYKEYVISYFSGFNGEVVQKINAMYNLMDVFLQVIHYDYFFLLKKFDSRITEADFKYKPRFEQINGEYVIDDLKDFMEFMPLVDDRQDWNTVFDVLQLYKGAAVINPAHWRSVARGIFEVHRSGILPLVVQHLDEDPYYHPKVVKPNHKIVEEYLSKQKTAVEMTIQKVLTEKRKNKIDDLADKVFGTTAVSRMRNYTEKANLTFSTKMLGGYIHVVPMNFLKAFLLDYLKTDMKTTIDLLLIRGQWAATVLSQQLSESYHRLVDLTEELLQFDLALAEDGEKGAAVKGALFKSDRDQKMMKILRQYITDINSEALRIIKESTQNLISVAKYLKAVLEDHKTKPAELILNWREIETASARAIDQSIAAIYRKIYHFSQLMQYYLRD